MEEWDSPDGRLGSPLDVSWGPHSFGRGSDSTHYSSISNGSSGSFFGLWLRRLFDSSNQEEKYSQAKEIMSLIMAGLRTTQYPNERTGGSPMREGGLIWARDGKWIDSCLERMRDTPFSPPRHVTPKDCPLAFMHTSFFFKKCCTFIIYIYELTAPVTFKTTLVWIVQHALNFCQ